MFDHSFTMSREALHPILQEKVKRTHLRDMNKRREPELQHKPQSWMMYRKRLYHFVLSRVDNASIAEDIVHDALLKAYKHRNTLKDTNKYLQWLYQITRNSIVDYYRTHKQMDELSNQTPNLEAHINSDVEREIAQCLVPLAQQ